MLVSKIFYREYITQLDKIKKILEVYLCIKEQDQRSQKLTPKEPKGDKTRAEICFMNLSHPEQDIYLY